MQKLTKMRKVLICFNILAIVLTLAFIWGNSIVPKTASAQGSSTIFEFIKPIADFLFGKDNFTHAHFRKLIHAVEFCTLAWEVVLLYCLLKSFRGVNYFLVFVYGLAVGIIDEVIQIFSSRGATVLDVVIDYLGYLFGVLTSFSVGFIAKKIKKHKATKS